MSPEQTYTITKVYACPCAKRKGQSVMTYLHLCHDALSFLATPESYAYKNYKSHTITNCGLPSIKILNAQIHI